MVGALLHSARQGAPGDARSDPINDRDSRAMADMVRTELLCRGRSRVGKRSVVKSDFRWMYNEAFVIRGAVEVGANYI